MSFCGSYGSRDYCVQYQESNLQFVQRLWEEEGISFHFEHEKNKDVVVLGDGSHAFATLPHYAEITHRDTPHLYEESLTEWRAESALHSGAAVLRLQVQAAMALNFRPKSGRFFPELQSYFSLASTWSRALGISLPRFGSKNSRRGDRASGHKQCSRAVSGVYVPAGWPSAAEEESKYLVLAVRHEGLSASAAPNMR